MSNSEAHKKTKQNQKDNIFELDIRGPDFRNHINMAIALSNLKLLPVQQHPNLFPNFYFRSYCNSEIFCKVFLVSNLIMACLLFLCKWFLVAPLIMSFFL